MIMSQIRYQDSPYRLENGVREAILQRDYAKGLVVLEGLYRLKYAGDTWLTFKEIFRLLRDNFDTAYQLVYQGLKSVLIFQRRKSAGVANRRGARPYLYRIPFPAELKAEFAPDLPPTPSDELTRADLRKVSTYKRALHRELLVRLWIASGGEGVMMFRDFEAERLSISKRTLRTWDKRLGFSHEANYIETRITKHNWNQLPRYKNKFDANGKRQPSRKWLKVVDWETGEIEILPHVRYLAYINLKADKAVYEVERTANTYHPYKFPERANLCDYDYDVAAHYFAHKRAKEAAGLYQDNDNRWHYRRE